MTARVIVPIIPDLMTRPELMEEVFIRAPALRSLEGNALAEDPRLAIGIYRAAVATGAMDFVRSSGNRPALRVQTHSSCLSKAPKSRLHLTLLIFQQHLQPHLVGRKLHPAVLDMPKELLAA
jgi:hypothetical protein